MQFLQTFVSEVKRNTIKARLVLFFTILIGLISLFIFLYFPSSLEEQAIKSTANKAQSITVMTGYSVGPALYFEDSVAVEDALAGALQNRDIRYVVVLDALDKVVAAFQVDEAERVHYNEMITKTQISSDRSVYQTMTSIHINNQRIGSFYLGLSLEELQTDLRNIRITIAVVSITVFLIGIIAVFSISTAVTVPLRQMVHTVEHITRGELSQRAPVTSKDEVGQLAISFNYMLDSLESARRELETLNKSLEKRVDERTQELQQEVNERKRAEAILAAEKRIFEMIAKGQQLNEVLNELCLSVQMQSSGMLCSVMLLDADGMTLRRGATPGLPERVAQRLDGIVIGTKAGAPGVAAYCREQIISSNISGDLLWGSLQEVFLSAGLQACWSTPFFSASGSVLGTFDIYSNVSRSPSPRDLALIERVTQLAGIAVERTVAESLLRTSEEKYRRLFEESKDGIFIRTPEGMLVDINPAGLEIYGCASKEELASIDIEHELYSKPEDREMMFRILMREGYVKDVQFEIMRKDGMKRMVLETLIAVRDEKDAVVAYRGIVRDVTEQKELENQLIQAQKMESIGTLAGGIAHDFNNILGIILGFSSRIGRRQTDPQTFKESIDSIKKAVQRGAALVRQLLTFARISDVVFESMSLNETVQEVKGMVAETFPKIIVLNVELADELPAIVADHNQIHQSLLNLCVNARDAMPQGGTLTIATEVAAGVKLSERFTDVHHDRYACIRISDTGTGMPDHVRNRIFEPFFTTKERGKGTGLGLAMVYGIVKSHQGFIDVDSEQGKGTTFRLYFPIPQVQVNDSGAQMQETEVRSAPATGTETILIVEDEEMLRELLKTLLEANGYRVLVAADGAEAVEVSIRHKSEITLVLTDMGLPKLGGWEVFKKIKDHSPHIKVVLASGYVDPALKLEMIREGAKDFIQKPYEPDIVLRRIREIIEDGVKV